MFNLKGTKKKWAKENAHFISGWVTCYEMSQLSQEMSSLVASEAIGTGVGLHILKMA